MCVLRVNIMSFIFLCSKQDILTPGFTMDTEQVDKTYKNNHDVQQEPERNKSNVKNLPREVVKVEIWAQTAPQLPYLLAPVQMTSKPLSLQIHCMYIYYAQCFL